MFRCSEVTISFYPSTKTLKIQGPKQLQYRSQLLKKCSEAKDENLCDTPNLQRSFDATLSQECESTSHCELPCSQETKKYGLQFNHWRNDLIILTTTPWGHRLRFRVKAVLSI